MYVLNLKCLRLSHHCETENVSIYVKNGKIYFKNSVRVTLWL